MGAQRALWSLLVSSQQSPTRGTAQWQAVAQSPPGDPGVGLRSHTRMSIAHDLRPVRKRPCAAAVPAVRTDCAAGSEDVDPLRWSPWPRAMKAAEVHVATFDFIATASAAPSSKAA
jgi:hypothetical protein